MKAIVSFKQAKSCQCWKQISVSGFFICLNSKLFVPLVRWHHPAFYKSLKLIFDQIQ